MSDADFQSRSTTMLWVTRILGIVAGAVFVYAGFEKVTEPVKFASDISNYHILPWTVGVRLAFYLPWLEIICGLALIFRRLFSGAVAITGLLMLVFIAATVMAKARGIDISCGCFGGAGKNLSFTWHLVLDVALVAALGTLWFTRPRAAFTR